MASEGWIGGANKKIGTDCLYTADSALFAFHDYPFFSGGGPGGGFGNGSDFLAPGGASLGGLGVIPLSFLRVPWGTPIAPDGRLDGM